MAAALPVGDSIAVEVSWVAPPAGDFAEEAALEAEEPPVVVSGAAPPEAAADSP